MLFIVECPVSLVMEGVGDGGFHWVITVRDVQGGMGMELRVSILQGKGLW